MTIELNYVKIQRSKNAKIPIMEGAGYTLFSSEKTIIKSGEKVLVPTGIFMAIPQGYYGQITNLDKNFDKLKLLGGVIDSDYRGELLCPFRNISNEDIVIDGPVCQIIIAKICTDQIIEVDSLENSAKAEQNLH